MTMFVRYAPIFLCLMFSGALCIEEEATTNATTKISQHILAIMEHYKNPDPVGIPGAPIPEPLPIPPMKKNIGFGTTMDFNNVQVYGLSKFRIIYIKSDLAAMRVDAGVQIDLLNVIGNYTIKSFFSRSAGPFTVKMIVVYATGVARLDVDRSGQLQAQEMDMDITFKNVAMDFKNLGNLGSIVQSVFNSAGSFLFDSIKPFILAEINQNIRGNINKQIGSTNMKFPNSISPFDKVVAEGRRRVREMGYDPYKVPDYNHTVGIFGIRMTHNWVTGLSSFYRVGNVTLEVRNHTLYAGMDVGTQKLKGTSHWEIVFGGGMFSRTGTLAFTAEYLKMQVILGQDLDTRKRATLEDVQLELGNIQIRCNGAGTIDYVIEFIINVFPNLLRYQIMDAVETPLKARIQQELDKYNVEESIHNMLPDVDKMQDSGFKF